MRRSLAWVGAVTALLAACGEGFTADGGGGEAGASQGGSSSGTGGSGGSTTSSGIGGSPVDCPADTVWAPPVPEGWDGPVIRTRAGDEGGLASCPSGDGQLLHIGLQGDEPASCSCGCGVPNPDSCMVVAELWSGNGNCVGASADSITLDGDCQNLGGAGTLVGSVMWASVPPQEGACESNSETIMGALSWAGHMRVCDGETTTVQGELCLTNEAGFDTQACIVQQGAVACPPGYPDQRVGFTGFQEGRGCSACTCDTSTASCKGHVTVYGIGQCGSADNGSVINADSCTPLVAATTITAISYAPTTAGSCTAGGGEPTGSVVKEGATTVCCTP